MCSAFGPSAVHRRRDGFDLGSFGLKLLVRRLKLTKLPIAGQRLLHLIAGYSI
jgi:hypothetical protein